jgi:hypothetical protein
MHHVRDSRPGPDDLDIDAIHASLRSFPLSLAVLFGSRARGGLPSE